MQRICITLVFLFALAIGMQAQPTTFGSTLVDGNYASYNLTDKGAFRQVRLQAANSAGALTRNWNFALGTAGNQDFSNSWRPYSGSCNGNSNLSISNYNQVIAPDLSFPSGTASAPLNNNGGCDGFFPAVAGGRYYTVNITESGGNNHMAILETAYAPATIDDVSGPACATNCGYTVTVTLSGPPASGEYVYVRYSTDGFATSGLAEVSNFTGAAGTAAIPDQGGSTVVYYAYTSPNTLAQINSAVSAYGSLAHDMLTLELGNNAGSNYSYGPCAISNPVAVCQNTSVQLDGTGNASITSADIDGGSFDNCGVPSLSVNQTAFSCGDQVNAAVTDLFFSEYVEGTGDNKYLEIYNGTGAAVDLSNYRVRLYANGNTSPNNDNLLSGTLNPGEVIVLANSSAAIYAGPVTAATAVNFNGNDAVELYNVSLGAPADIIGRIGEDPGTEWIGGGNSTLNRTLRRKSTVTGGVTANPGSGFPTLATEWDGFGTNVISDLGSHGIGVTVTLTATGDGGAQSSCLAVVTVVDNEMPEAVCQNITVDIEAGGEYTLTAADIDGGSSDNCTANLSIPETVFGCSDVGSMVSVTLTVTDDSGNSDSCPASVTVADGNNICNQLPTAACQPVTVDADANCQATVAAEAFDGGSTDPEMGMLSFSVDPAGPYPLGVTDVTLTVTDPGGASDDCMTTITVVDNLAPTIACPDDIAINIGGQCQALVPNFTGESIIIANSVAGFSATQGLNGWFYGQYLTGGFQDFSQLPAYNAGVPQWQDNQAFNTPFLDAYGGHPGVDDFKLAVRRWVSPYTGTADISLAFYDRDGSCGDGAHVRVFLNGTQVWEYLNVPTTLVTQSFSQSIAAGDVLDFAIDPIFDTGCDNTQFTALISVPNSLSTSDNCGPVTVGQSPAPGTLVGVGPTTVTLTANDGASDSEPCTVDLIVVDNIAPAAACQPATVQLDASGTGSITAGDVFDAVNSSDNCGSVNPQSVSPSSFTCMDLGENPVTLTVNDGHGNTATCSATVTVLDNLNPAAACQPATVQLDASGTGSIAAGDVFDAVNSSDNCGTANPQSVSPSSFTCVDLGENPVTLTVNDGHGNTATCSATVTVLDNLNPAAACQPATVQLDASGTGSIAAGDVFDAVNSSDNCGTVNPQSVSPSSFTCVDLGENPVTLTVNDGHGNTATCSATVTVLDNLDPAAACQPATVQLDASGTGSIAAGDVFDAVNSSDNCGTVNPQSVSPSSFTCANLGENPVTLTVNDGHGNTATCSATVTVLDNLDPAAACQPATVQLDASGTGSIAAADVFDAVNSSDNCGTANPQSVSPSSFTCADLGENPVTLTVNDGHGNTATCSATVTVADPNGFCSQVVCLDGEIAKLVMDVEGMGLNSSIERAITSRLELAAYKFCLWNSASTAISNLENIITYVQYQRGRYIPIGQANYIIGQIQALIDALNDGIAECCSGAARGPQPANVVEGSEALKLEVAPNPFRSETGIQFYLPDAGPASLDVFNLQGQRVRSLLAETLDAGRHARQWDGTADGGQALSAGVYLVRLRTEAGVLVKKVSLAR